MRSTSETIELDLALRQSRTIYVSLALVFLPLAVFGLINAMSAVGAIIESLSGGYFPAGLGWSLLVLTVSVVAVGAEFVVISQTVEANRRLRILRDNPDQIVRKLPAPFQSSLFGPYH